MGGPGRGLGVPVERPKDFRNTVRRLGRRLKPERFRIAWVVLMGSASVAFTVFGPKILGKRDRRLVQRGNRQASARRHDQGGGDRHPALEGRGPAR